ncbi:hypothetical protein PIB30_095333 [Stylosanthes scabra]|uniref:Uncharacterized protein n=1 Tax=Stylosanthes scabra TaxID=79078 RepID=A0ABU6YWA5_9FABA|nr:hypothetical protein [Stylosanthes scabra]
MGFSKGLVGCSRIEKVYAWIALICRGMVCWWESLVPTHMRRMARICVGGWVTGSGLGVWLSSCVRGVLVDGLKGTHMRRSPRIMWLGEVLGLMSKVRHAYAWGLHICVGCLGTLAWALHA